MNHLQHLLPINHAHKLDLLLPYTRRAISFLLFVIFSHSVVAANCLYVSSYHIGYEWNDGIERGINQGLNNKCTIDRFYMDTKRNPDKEFAKQMALAAKKHIEDTKPDVVIACDDNASRYLVMPYFKDADLPIVFCGLNWTVSEYSYPYTNTTGMVEVVPIRPLLDVVKNVVKSIKNGVYLSPDVHTEHKDFLRYKKIYTEHNITLEGVFVKTLADWKKAYLEAQKSDLIVLGNNAGINDWNAVEAAKYAEKHATTFSVTNYDWMMPYAMFAMTKIPEEQGEWAAEVALSIINGQHPADIPIVVNRKWNIFANPHLLESANVKLSPHLLQNATKVGN